MDGTYKILFEASGSLTSAYLFNFGKLAGAEVVASDISECFGQYLADDFIEVPKHNDPDLWVVLEAEMKRKKINIVVPSFDETLMEWSERKAHFMKEGIFVILSDKQTLECCMDKWETFLFFKRSGIPTPETSLDNVYPLIKPRYGRGGKGILINADNKEIDMTGMISQELLEGQEYTIDVFCDRTHAPVYIIPRKRLSVKDGKSVNGITVFNERIISHVKNICNNLPFTGPINLQCFEGPDGSVKFTEINPRIGGGMALGFAASDNWIKLIIDNLVRKLDIEIKPVNYGLKMLRYYAEVFVS